MLKRIAHISLIMLLLLSTSGITVYKHYCGNTLMGSSIVLKPKGCCKPQCKCCHDETKYLKITDTFESQKASLNLQADFTKLFNNLKFATPWLSSTFENSSNSIFNQIKICNVLPLAEANPIALLQVFRL